MWNNKFIYLMTFLKPSQYTEACVDFLPTPCLFRIVSQHDLEEFILSISRGISMPCTP